MSHRWILGFLPSHRDPQESARERGRGSEKTPTAAASPCPFRENPSNADDKADNGGVPLVSLVWVHRLGLVHFLWKTGPGPEEGAVGCTSSPRPVSPTPLTPALLCTIVCIRDETQTPTSKTSHSASQAP
ncbi:hypothetical protein WMY93_001282 [Mugilogobius chulae]|uniref:Uncharacterized protein n=1 Tax=Mugilogobius chulae TaxID=88201 RepID=A0AAW0Q7P2_9GOBI